MARSHFNKNSLLVQSVPCSKTHLKKSNAFQWMKTYIYVNLRNLIPPFPSINIKDKVLEETANKN